jgi:hypothetical protein
MHITSRRLMSALVLMLAVLGFTPVLSANTGSAVIAHWRVFYRPSTTPAGRINGEVRLSNVSAHDIQVTLRLWDQDGNTIGSITGLAISAGGGLTSCNPTNNVCTLPAGKSGVFGLTHTVTTVDSDVFGHGTLEWSSGTDSVSTALVADGQITYAIVGEGAFSRQSMLITRNQPF